MPPKGYRKAALVGPSAGPYRTVFGVPPEPWPDIPDGFVFGPEWEPAGTTYLFDERSLLEREAEHGHPLGWIAEHLLGFGRLIDGSATWTVPVRYARAQIVASLPGGEELIHSLAYRPTDESMVVNGNVLAAFAGQLAQHVGNWVEQGGVATILSSQLVYNQINISYIEQNQGTDKSGKGGDQKTLVPTIQVPITPVHHGSAAAALLPYECALCLTLNTDTRGPTTRGRVYVGGLTTASLAANGLYSHNDIQNIAQVFGTEMVAGIHDNTTWRLNIVSRRTASAREVQGVSVGVVPDSQRRRRNSLAENRFQAWGTAAGAVPPG